MCQDQLASVSCGIQPSGVGIIIITIIIPILQMRKRRSAQRVRSEPGCAEGLDAKATTHLGNQMAEEQRMKRVGKEPRQLWAKQAPTSWGRPKPGFPPPPHSAGLGWPGRLDASPRKPKRKGGGSRGSSNNKDVQVNLKQNTSDGQKRADSGRLPLPGVCRELLPRSLRDAWLCHLGHQRVPLS